MDFVLKLKDITQFEPFNNILVNVYGMKTRLREKDFCCHIACMSFTFHERKKKSHVNLLLVTNDDGQFHFCLIKDMSGLISEQKFQEHKFFSYL